MTEAERTALIHQINIGANLSSHQMDAVMGALHHLKWGPKMNSDLTSTAPLPNYNAPTPARCEPPEGTKNGTYHVHDGGDAKRVCKWANHRWYNSSGQSSQTAGEAENDGWRYSHAVQMDPPVPDQHAALRDAVVEAAMKAYYKGWLPRHIDEVSKSCAALAAAQNPPNPAKELRRAMAAVTLIGPSEAAAHLEIAIDRAIAALQGDGT